MHYYYMNICLQLVTVGCTEIKDPRHICTFIASSRMRFQAGWPVVNEREDTKHNN